MAHREFADLAQQWLDLEKYGIPLEPLDRRGNNGLTIKGGDEPWQYVIRELNPGSFGYEFPIFVRRNLPGKTIIRSWRISTPWEDHAVTLIDAQRDPEGGPAWYSFPGQPDGFDYKEILNHRICGTLSRGEILEGLVLAVGTRPPDEYKNRQKVPITFAVLDQWDCEHAAVLKMNLVRYARKKTLGTPNRVPLFSRKRVIHHDAPAEEDD